MEERSGAHLWEPGYLVSGLGSATSHLGQGNGPLCTSVPQPVKLRQQHLSHRAIVRSESDHLCKAFQSSARHLTSTRSGWR